MRGFSGSAPDANQEREGGVKCTVAGNIGTGFVSAMVNKLANDQPLPSPRQIALVRAFLAVNELEWEHLHSLMKEKLRELDPETLGPNGLDILNSHYREWLLNHAQTHFQSAKRPVRMPKHYDGGAGYLLFAACWWGCRHIDLFMDDEAGKERAEVLSMHCKPGHCYIAGMSTVEHQVCHDLTGSQALPHLPPFEGPVEVALVVRCTLFRHDKARNCNGLEGRGIFQPLQAALCKWFESCSLRLPTLAECRAQLGASPRRMTRKQGPQLGPTASGKRMRPA